MKKNLLAFLLSTLCLTKMFAQTYTEVEPNNSFAQANLVTAPVTIIDSMQSGSDLDYFMVNLTSCGVLTITVSNIPANQLIRLLPYNSSLAAIGFSQSPGSGIGFTTTLLLPSGITYFSTQDMNGNISTNAFNLSLSLDTSDACECNNSFATACLISPSTTIYPQIFGKNNDLGNGGNDIDYFQLNLPTCGVVSINLSNLAPNQLIRMLTFNSSFTQIDFRQSASNGVGFTRDLLLPAGISYFSIQDMNGNSDSTHLNLALSYDTSDACECNNSFATACLISPSVIIHPQIFGKNNDLGNGGNDIDYFQLNLPTCGVVSVNLSNLAPNQLIRMLTFNSSFTSIDFKQSSSNGVGFTRDLLLPSGISYFSIQDMNGNSDSTHLNLALSYDTSDACECNNSPASACVISSVDTLYPQMFGVNNDLGGNDIDYFKFQTTNCVNECIAISNVPISQLLRLLVLDSLQTQIGFAQSPSAGIGFTHCLNLGIHTYYLKLVDLNGMSSSNQITMILSNTPTLLAPVINQNGNILSTTLTYASYLWSPGNDTSSSIICSGNGIYTVTVTDANGCTNSATLNVTGCTTGIGELNGINNSISIYPNPSKDVFAISVDSEIKNPQIVISNVLGEKILEQKITSLKTEINLNSEPPGIYFVSVRDEKNNMLVKKIVKQ